MNKTASMFYWVRGWVWLFQNPRYLTLVFAPVLLGLLLVGSGFYFLFPVIPGLSDLAVSFLPDVMQGFAGSALYALIWILLLFSFMGLGFLLLYGVYMILCAPFHALLVEAVLRRSQSYTAPQLSFGAWFLLTLKMLRTSLIKAFFFMTLGLMAFVISLIPGLQWVMFVTTAAIFAFDSVDYSFEALGYGFKKRLGYVFGEKRQFFLLTLGMTLTMMIPGLTFLALPGAVVGAALDVKVDSPSKQ